MDKRYQVFVSSTYADLKEERQKVIHTLMQMNCIPAGMELFPAADEEQLQFIKRIIDDCDYYLLIIGGRYGSVTDEGISYTEKEYEYALERKIKVIAFLHKNPEQIPVNKSEQKSELREKLENFRSKVDKTRLVQYWQNIEELPGLVALSLINTIKLYPAVGWVRADKVSGEELLTEINELRKKNEQLQKELSEFKSSIFTAEEEKEFSHIYKIICRSEVINVTYHTAIFGSDSSTSESFTYEEQDRSESFNVNLASLIALLPTTEAIYENYWEYVPDGIIEQLVSTIDSCFFYTAFSISMWQLADELLTYGFLKKQYITPLSPQKMSFPSHEKITSELVYSEKLERYKYWLRVNDKMPKCIERYV